MEKKGACEEVQGEEICKQNYNVSGDIRVGVLLQWWRY